MRIEKWLSSLVVSGAVAGGASKGGEPGPTDPPWAQVMPATRLAAAEMQVPPEPKKAEPKKEAPKKEEPKQPAAPNPDQFAGATEAGTQPGEQFNPYMFGDQIRIGRGTTTSRVGSLVGQSFLTNNGATNTIVNLSSTGTVFNIPITNSNISAVSGGPPNLTFPQQFPATAVSGPISTTATTAVTGSQAQLVLFPVPGASFTGGGVPLQNNPVFQNYIDSVFKSRFGSNGQTVFTGASLSAGTGTTGVPGTAGGTAYQFNFAPDSLVYYGYDYVASLSLPLPSAGGVVGTTKVSENNSPMPRDRVIFSYDYFSNVPIAAGGFNVNRFSPGFEKTFFNGRTSFEMQFPFASTVDPTAVSDGLTNRATVFGNISMVFKGLLWSAEEFALSTGIGVALPTSPDTRLLAADGSDLVRIRNRSWLMAPFLAGLWTPTERFYSQAWAQLSFDASGSPVYADPGTGLIGAGRLYDQTILQLDVQAGYWLIRNPQGSFLTALAPFLELHYNTPLNDAGFVTAGSFAIGSSTNRYDEFNIATGLNMVLSNRVNLLAGVVLPLRPENDRFFDAQFGLRMNWMFGAGDGRSLFTTGF